MSDSRAEYQRRLHRVLAHIDAHLAGPLDLPALAAVAHFSPFHFHRLFAALTGETLGDYVRRRRLEVAAGKLAAQPRLGVLEAALAVGFGSSEAFARAFKLHFGASPTAWRRRQVRNPGQVQRKIDQAAPAAGGEDAGTAAASTEAMHHAQLQTLPPVRVAYLRHTGPYGPPVLRFWQQQVGPWLQREGWLGRTTYGIGHDDPSISDPAGCRYDACVELRDAEQPGRDVLVATLPGGRYAVLRFDAPIQHIEQAWAALLRDWLPGTGLQLDTRPCFERYPPGDSYDPATGVLVCDLCIPVAPL